jgi:hypothetical protein
MCRIYFGNQIMLITIGPSAEHLAFVPTPQQQKQERRTICSPLSSVVIKVTWFKGHVPRYEQWLRFTSVCIACVSDRELSLSSIFPFKLERKILIPWVKYFKGIIFWNVTSCSPAEVYECFQREIFLPSSESKNKPSRKPASAARIRCMFLPGGLFEILKDNMI